MRISHLTGKKKRLKWPNWLAKRWPVSRKRYDQKEAARKQFNDLLNARVKSHEEQIIEERSRVNDLMAKLSRVQWDRSPQSRSYILTMHFSPELINGGFGYGDQHDIDRLAYYFARRVEYDIKSMRFVKEAIRNERERIQPRDYPGL